MTLLDLMERYRGAIQYDWRTRFQLGLDSIGREMSWIEALGNAQILVTDPSSQLAAAYHGWDHPIDRASLVLMNLFDYERNMSWQKAGRKGKQPKPYPRPWPEIISRKTQPDDTITHEQIVAALRFAGHTAELPT